MAIGKSSDTTPYELRGKSVWDDIRFPFAGINLDTASGRIDYNYVDLGVDFANNSRYATTEQISMICQMQHDWEIGTDIHPHLHWIQNQDETPNWLLEYRAYRNGDAPPAFTTVAYTGNEVTYVSGDLAQITLFPMIDMSSFTLDTDVSVIVDLKFFRDTGNTSGKFSGADAYVGDALSKEFDVHYRRDSVGSRLEYLK